MDVEDTRDVVQGSQEHGQDLSARATGDEVSGCGGDDADGGAAACERADQDEDAGREAEVGEEAACTSNAVCLLCLQGRVSTLPALRVLMCDDGKRKGCDEIDMPLHGKKRLPELTWLYRCAGVQAEENKSFDMTQVLKMQEE